jgi:hypothetical protein
MLKLRDRLVQIWQTSQMNSKRENQLPKESRESGCKFTGSDESLQQMDVEGRMENFCDFYGYPDPESSAKDIASKDYSLLPQDDGKIPRQRRPRKLVHNKMTLAGAHKSLDEEGESVMEEHLLTNLISSRAKVVQCHPRSLNLLSLGGSNDNSNDLFVALELMSDGAASEAQLFEINRSRWQLGKEANSLANVTSFADNLKNQFKKRLGKPTDTRLNSKAENDAKKGSQKKRGNHRNGQNSFERPVRVADRKFMEVIERLLATEVITCHTYVTGRKGLHLRNRQLTMEKEDGVTILANLIDKVRGEINHNATN